MHDALPVSVAERVGNRDRVAERFLQRQRSPRQPIRQALSLQVLHDEKVDAVLRADIVERTRVSFELHPRVASINNVFG